MKKRQRPIDARLEAILTGDMAREDKLAEIVGDHISDQELRALTPRQREAIALTRGGLTCAEAATVMEIGVETVRTHLRAARQIVNALASEAA